MTLLPCPDCRKPEVYRIEIREAGRWWQTQDTAETLEDALLLAGSLTPAHNEDAIRVVCPDGKVL
jgi:hypothetical protein